jgi:predicted CXXCH cytochrome family protein
MEQRNARKYWIIWIATTVLASSVLAVGLVIEKAHEHPVLAQARSLFSPGRMTSGHHQIELACEACHTSPFGGRDVLQKACVRCHGEELAEADDKHPLTKFTDPRNADLLERLDARECVTCHVEHKPQMTLALGVTQPADFCMYCHQDVATERPSHRDMKFDSCTASGCHNFHDNRALYEDFLVKHSVEPDNKARALLPKTNFLEVAALLPTYPLAQFPIKALTLADADAPVSTNRNTSINSDWLASAHARAGVTCSACHARSSNDQLQNTTPWTDHPSEQICKACHALETDGFLSGKHGMRLREDLSPMTPAQGRLIFKDSAAHRELRCTTCHAAHRFDTTFAAVKACEQCHNDDHTLAYQRSPHAELWRREVTHDARQGSGVSCASCHMPRLTHDYEDQDLRQIFVQHHQNDTLRPNDKMIRPVCMSCHGLRFSIDALADPTLVRNNFSGPPTRHIASIDMALENAKHKGNKKRAAKSR